eukprot:SM000009S23447  [mRNA]  locus=s9:26780:27341:- [translate_table: standard]
MAIWALFQAVLLLLNAAAVLNEDRFLAPYGWGFQDMHAARTSPLKVQIIGMLHAVQYLRVPLLAANLVTIFMKLLFG